MRTILGPLVVTFVVHSLAAAQVPAPPDVNDAEFRCMYGAAKADAKFPSAKAKCIAKCFAYFWKGVGPVTDCLAPYGGFTKDCIYDSVYFRRGAENKFEAAMKKYCVLASGADCPECYESGDCTNATLDRVQSVENIIDSFIPGLFCETTGAEPEEQKCQIQTTRALTKYYGVSLTCYNKCFADARANGRALEECLPPVANSRWFGCLTAARAKVEATIHKYCHDTSTPLAAPECGPDPYPSEGQWADLMDIVVQGVLPQDFCVD